MRENISLSETVSIHSVISYRIHCLANGITSFYVMAGKKFPSPFVVGRVGWFHDEAMVVSATVHSGMQALL